MEFIYGRDNVFTIFPTGPNKMLYLHCGTSVKIASQESSKKSGQVKGQAVMIGQVSTSYKSTTINTYVVDGILRYSLREIDHVQIFTMVKG